MENDFQKFVYLCLHIPVFCGEGVTCCGNVLSTALVLFFFTSDTGYSKIFFRVLWIFYRLLPAGSESNNTSNSNCDCRLRDSPIPDSEHYMSTSCVASWTIQATVRGEIGMCVWSLIDFFLHNSLARNKSHLLKSEGLIHHQTWCLPLMYQLVVFFLLL